MRMGWLVTLVLVIAATMPPIAVGQAQAQEAQGEKTEKCSLPRGGLGKRSSACFGRAPGMGGKVVGQ